MSEGREENTFLMLPFMAYGHFNPFLALAKQLEKRGGCAITIVSTPASVRKLKSLLPSTSKIRLAEIPFNGSDFGLPPGTENTDKLPYELLARFLEASESLEPHFKELLVDMTEKEGNAPVCVISDMFLGWTVRVANELGMFHTVFIAGSGYSMGIYFSLSLNVSQCSEEEEKFPLLDFPEASQLHRSRLSNDLKYSNKSVSWFRFRERQFLFCLSSDAILLNSIEDLDPNGAKYFNRKTGGKPVWMIGPACPTAMKREHKQRETEATGEVSDDFLAWLDLHPPGSVLYVCFGSQNNIKITEMKELARALEACGKAFIWVIKSPIGFNVTEEFKAEWLPDGFEEGVRKRNQGLLVRHWAPQVEILSHKSTGAFVTHCGWNSVLESLSHGVPIIGWPLAGEQFFNSYLLEKEVGVCLEIARGVDSTVIQQDHIARAIDMVMGNSERGEEIRRKTRQIQKKLEDAVREREGCRGSSVKAMDEFVAMATSNSKKASHCHTNA